MDEKYSANSNHRRHRLQICSLTAAVVIASVFVYWTRSYNNRVVKAAACYSYVSSLASTLCGDFQNRTDIVGASDENWRQLDAEQYKALATNLIEHGYGFDDSQRHSKDPATIFLDYWDKPLIIACRRAESGKLEFCVWSRGPDGEFGTEDDIIVPPIVVAEDWRQWMQEIEDD